MPSASQPPASTIIADRIVAANGENSEQLQRERFLQLLEVSTSLDENGQPNIGTDVASNQTLILIIFKAGLDLFADSNPFGAVDSDLAPSVRQSLQVVRLALKRSPEVLLQPIGSNTLLEDLQDVPLFIWLLPKLLSLIESLKLHADSETVSEIRETLTLIVELEGKCSRSARYFTSISAFFQNIINEVFTLLEKRESQAKPSKKIPLSDQNGLFSHFFEDAGLSAAVIKSDFILGDFFQTFKIACSILESLICGKCVRPVSSIPERPIISRCLDAYQRLWQIIRSCRSRVNVLKEVIPTFFASLRVCLVYTAQTPSVPVPNQKGNLIWGQAFGSCISIYLDNDGFGLEILEAMLNDTILLLSNKAVNFSAAKVLLLADLLRLQSKVDHLGVEAQAITNLIARITQTLAEKVDSVSGARKSTVVEDLPDQWSEGRPQKRTKLAEDATQANENNSKNHVQRLLKKLQAPEGTCFEDLPTLAPDLMKKLPADEQWQAFSSLSVMACFSATRSDASFDHPGICPCCDTSNPPSFIDSVASETELTTLFETLLKMYPVIQKSSKARISAVLAVRKLLMHSIEPKYMKLAESPVGELCLQSMKSSVRELRIAAAYTVPIFLIKRQHLPFDIIRDNRVLLLNFIAGTYSKNEVPTQEACIFALEQVALVAGDQELNIILIRLVEYLGHPNQYISGFAYSQLQKIAWTKEIPPAALFRPYWRTISVVIVQNLQSRPIIAENVCRLLGMTLEGLLMMTEEFTLPYLVLARKNAVIERIARAHGQGMTPYGLCTQHHNLAAIIAYLISQPAPDTEQLVITLLAEVSPDFNRTEFASWMRMEPILTLCELLKNIVDAGEGRSAKAHQAMQLLATFDPNLRGRHGGASRRQDLVGAYLEQHVLGITATFAAVLNVGPIVQSNVEKRRCLAAIGELMKLGKGRLSIALPQICACLRSALDNTEICDQAFMSWCDMISSLKSDDIEPLIDQTVSIIIQFWDCFQTPTQERAYDLMAFILKNHTAMIREIFQNIPSLASIPVMAKFESEIGSLKKQMDLKHQLIAFGDRCKSEAAAVVEQTLKELIPFLEARQEFIHRSVLNEQADSTIVDLTRSILDCCVRFNGTATIATNSAKCLGLIGCLDPNHWESVREKTEIVIPGNFVREEETSEFVLAFLQNVAVNAFLSASNTRSQGFLAWAMQELLQICNFTQAVTHRRFELSDKYNRWMALPDGIRNTLTPFLTSKYTVAVGAMDTRCEYPVFHPGKLNHSQWLRTIVLDMLQVQPSDNSKLIYPAFARVVRNQDLAIPTFLLPFVSQTFVVGGTEPQKSQLASELLLILNYPLAGDHQSRETIKACSESVFQIIEHLSAWAHTKRKQIQSIATSRPELRTFTDDPEVAKAQIEAVEVILQKIPPEVISRRAVECKSFSRALFHWEQYIRRIQKDKQGQEEHDDMLIKLQDIYQEIDEPDGIEGISAQLIAPNLGQQILEHRKAQRWTAAQRWYELQLDGDPKDGDVQANLLTCLRESGQFDVLLNQYKSLQPSHHPVNLLPFAVEASWATAKWAKMEELLRGQNKATGDYNIGIGLALGSLSKQNRGQFDTTIKDMQTSLGQSLTTSNTSSIQSCHDVLLKLHILTEVEALATAKDKASIITNLDRRLSILGAYTSDKQYVLGLRRATMQLTRGFTPFDVAATWLISAKLARKSGAMDQALNAVLHATHLGDRSASIEQARLLWKEGQQRRAIQILEGAIESGSFRSHTFTSEDASANLTADQQQEQNLVTARAHLLLAKWLDLGGQTQSEVIVRSYKKATDFHRRWDKGHYYLGKHYNKLIDSEKMKPPGKEAKTFVTGEMAKIVIDNYLRAAMLGSKYIFQTLPKILTLWLELVDGLDQVRDPRRGNDNFHAHTAAGRKKIVDEVNAQMKKYIDRIPAYSLYTILPQVVARIVHANSTVYNNMVSLIVKVVRAYPQQAMWTVLAIVKSSNKERANRGIAILSKIVETQKRSSKEASAADLRALITHGQKLSDELLRVSEYHIEGKASRVSLSRDLGFNHKIAPSKLVVPIEASLIPSMPANSDAAAMKSFKAFPKEAVTIQAFLDDALVLSSLQKPRKLTIRGSDGRNYGIMAKPKDDLRKDQRLMEFNTMINRFLKRDVEASKRRLYIRTYAVVPLNEECGLVEWVDNLKTFREILLKIYKEKGTSINYIEIRNLLDEACSGDPAKLDIFDKRLLKMFPPVFHEWFTETFPEPSTWFAARLRYTRTAAVMSIVGHVLGLGDRHGENISFEEDNGGTLHVDFNCLFDKGLTFEKPEMVPFRLTHNMVDAFGPYRYDGPFRRCCEITLHLLRANEEALMTILETFLHDPTTDFIGTGAKRKNRNHNNPLASEVPDTPLGVLDGVRGKVRGLLPTESVPLSVGGYVEEMIKRAVDRRRLAAMYIGWCAFF